MHRIKPTARRFENQCSVVWHAAEERRKERHLLRRSFVAEDVFLGFIAAAPWRLTPGPCNRDLNGAACCGLVAQAPGRKGAFVPDSSEPRRVGTKPVTTAAPLPAWATRQGIGLSHRGDLG